MFDELKEKIAAEVAEKLDEQFDDGIVQKIVGETLALVGGGMMEAGNLLAGQENEDGDE